MVMLEVPKHVDPRLQIPGLRLWFSDLMCEVARINPKVFESPRAVEALVKIGTGDEKDLLDKAAEALMAVLKDGNWEIVKAYLKLVDRFTVDGRPVRRHARDWTWSFTTQEEVFPRDREIKRAIAKDIKVKLKIATDQNDPDNMLKCFYMIAYLKWFDFQEMGLLSRDLLSRAESEYVPLMEREVTKAFTNKDITRTFDLFEAVADNDSPFKSALEDKDLPKVVQEYHRDLCEPFLQRAEKEYGEALKSIKTSRNRGRRLVLASCAELDIEPVKNAPVLWIARWAMKMVGGITIAGDAYDIFHKTLMNPDFMNELTRSWRIAWQGKLETAFDLDEPLDLIGIKGGPETEWERKYMLEELPKAHTSADFRVLLVDTLDEYLKLLATPEAIENHKCSLKPPV